MHKRLAVAVEVLLVLLIPLVVLAQADTRVYAPMVHRGDSGPPRADEQCAAADPGPINDLNLWVTPTTPQQGGFFSVCVRWLRDGQPVVGATGTVLVERYARDGTIYEPTSVDITTDANGMIALVFSTGTAVVNDRIDIRVSFDSPDQVNIAGTTILVGGADAPTPTPVPTPTPQPTPVPTPVPACDPSYPTVCIPPPPPELNCPDIPYRNFQVLPPDPHDFDGNENGIGCEE